MSANPLRHLPALVLLVVLGLLPLQAWRDVGVEEVVARSTVDGLHGVRWVAAVAPDGRLSVRITYDLGDETLRLLDVRVPDGGRYVAVDGVPVAADIGRYASELPVAGTATVTYELPGAVTRYADGAVLRLLDTSSGSLDGDAAMFPCPRCTIDPVGYGDVPVDGAIHTAAVPGEVTVWMTGVDALRASTEPGLVRFAAVGDGDASSLLAVLPAAAVPDAPLADGSVDDVVDTARADVASAGGRIRLASGGADAGAAVTAIVLSAVFAALIAWIAWRLRLARRERDPRRDDVVPVGVDAVTARPSDLEPALAAIAVGGAGPGERSAVAGTLLELARRDVIRIDGIDSRRFTLTIPAGARGDTPFEEAVLARLRPQGQLSATATLTGPPLWGPDGPAVARALRRVLVVQALKRRLVRFTLSALVLVPVSVVMGVVAVVGSDGRSRLAWFATLGGPVLALVAAVASGVSLTATGREERRRWLRYADWLRENTQLARVGAPGVATWGEVLPHAAALGAAPVAAEALSPRRGATVGP